MSSKVLSYCLYEPKAMPQHRFWDPHKNDSARYWFNLPVLGMVNNILYSDFTMKIHVSENVWDNKLSKILEIMTSELENVVVETIDMEYDFTEPGIWRMRPLWAREAADIFHTRDLDSLPSEAEYRFTIFFEKSSCSLGTIRTHENHYGAKCRMLAGLSSFKPQKIPPNIKWDSFNTYYSFRHGRPSSNQMLHGNYTTDQDLMIKFFTTNEEFTKDNFLDFATYNQKNKQDFVCVEATEGEIFGFEIEEQQRKMLDSIREYFGEFWAGAPLDVRGPFMNSILESAPTIKERINSNNTLREFYQRSL